MHKKFIYLILSGIFLISVNMPSMAVEPTNITNAMALQGTLSAFVDELRSLANDALAAGDQVMENRLEQAANEVELLIPKLQPVILGVEKSGNNIINNVSREFTTIITSLRSDEKKIGAYASAKLNNSLALLSQSFDEIPFINVDPIVLAISPSRLLISNNNKQIRLFGYLPGDVNEDITVNFGGKKVNVIRSTGNSLSFMIPDDYKLVEGTAIPVDITIRKASGLFNLFHDEYKISDVVVVGREKPFTCNVETFRLNPNLLEEVKATKTISYQASTQGGQNRPNENKKVLSGDLFYDTMGNDSSQYDLTTVIIKESGASFTSYGECGGAGPSGEAKITESGKAINIHISAPRLRDSVRGHGFHRRFCHGGGTKGVINLTPTFSVAKKETPTLVSVNKHIFNFGYEGVQYKTNLPNNDPWTLHTKCTYNDGTEKWSTNVIVINNQDRSEEGRGVSVNLNDDEFNIEAIDPLRFDDDLQKI